MAIKASQVKKGTEVLTGLYPLELTSLLEEKKEYGEVLIFVFTVTSGDGEGRIVKGMATRHDPLPQRCKLYNWAAALLGHKPAPREAIDWEGLIGKKCLGEIEPKETGSGTFERVKRLHPERLVK